MVTKMRDIARLADVSESTVSRVINNNAAISEETRKRVEDLIKKYNYRPNRFAKGLSGKTANVICIFVLDISSESKTTKLIDSPFLSEFIFNITSECEKLEYNIMLSIINDYGKFSEIRRLFDTGNIAGAIVMGNDTFSGEIEALVRKGYKIVTYNFNLRSEGKHHYNFVLDNAKGASLAVRKLIELGHSRIAHITGNREKSSVRERLQGYKEELDREGIPFRDDYVFYQDMYRAQGGYDAVNCLMNYTVKPTAIFFATDILMIGGVKALHQRGLSVPEDLSVIGFDGIAACEYFHPRLSSVEYSINEISELIITNLYQMIRYKNPGDSVAYDKFGINHQESIKNIGDN